MKENYIIYNKSCLKMSNLKDHSIKLVFTSPPYWDLKDYEIKDQIGYKQTYNKYLEDLNKVWKECFRVLDKDGVIAININSRTVQNQYYPIHIDFYEQLKKIGFKNFKMYIWHKSSGVPTQKNKLTDRFEYIIIASKGKLTLNKYYIYNDYKNNDLKNINSWHIVKNAGSILSKHPHPAFYPVALAERGINLFTKKGDTILDPFLGSGSTLFASYKTGRNCIGYEINPAYIKTTIETKPKDLKIKIIS